MVDLILFPSSYFNASKVDEDLQAEYDAVKATGLFDVILFGYDKWFEEDQLVIKDIPQVERTAVYRGYMMNPEKYERFYQRLLENNIRLITTSEEYELMHIFPNVYELLKEDTAKMEIYPLHTQINMDSIKHTFGRFMVKDFVKSVKGTEFPKYFDKDITQEEFDQWMEVFYINNKIATITRNSGQSINALLPPQQLLEKYSHLESGYYTVDYAELEDGSWKIIEAGDGQVSGLAEHQDYEQYFKVLYEYLNE